MAVVGILALIALPSYIDKIVRDQIAEALPLADVAKQPINAAWALGADLPADNAAAGLPAADRIVNSLVSSVTVQDGAIHIRFGNRAHRALNGKTLSLRPAVVEDTRVVPVAWLCAKAPVPAPMSVRGVDRTDVPAGLLPLRCR